MIQIYEDAHYNRRDDAVLVVESLGNWTGLNSLKIGKNMSWAGILKDAME